VTNENRRRNIADEVARAEQALTAARSLLGLALFADSVSRAYYAAFHFLRALLYARGVEPKSHAGALHMFNVEYIRAGVFPSTHNRLLGGMQRARELADYDAAVVFAEADALASIADAEAFRADAIARLRTDGWIPGA
jgi:uncharacterized protein (UPF0332 family)